MNEWVPGPGSNMAVCFGCRKGWGFRSLGGSEGPHIPVADCTWASPEINIKTTECIHEYRMSKLAKY